MWDPCHHAGVTDRLAKGANIAVAVPAVRVVLEWQTGPQVADVDISALLLGASGRVDADHDFVFYNQPVHPSGAVRHEGKQVGPWSYDALRVELARVPAERVVIAAPVDSGTFGQVPGLRLRLIDVGSGAELVQVDLTDVRSETALVCGEFYRRAGAWKFRAVGQGYDAGLAGLARDFGIRVGDLPPVC